MTFTNLTFLFGFLPIVLLLYPFVRKTRFSNLFILIASLIFYGWGGLRSLLVLLLVLVWNYSSTKAIAQCEDEKKKKNLLFLAIGVNVLVLFFYRYLGVWFGGFSSTQSKLPATMPVGLSFYLFSCLSCLIDVYRNSCPAPASFVDFGVFAAFFGRVNMGPIGHYAKFEEQLHNHKTTRKKTAEGWGLFMQGLFRKVLIADNFALVYNALAGNTSWLGNLLFGFAYFFQLYFDFSGYSRMARGLGSMFGFTIPENFRLPYTAQSVQDFWRRWHISLTDWFRSYIYIPLGGNRVAHSRWILNVLTVWMLTGLWHGATWPFVIWGLYQGGLILAEHAFLNKFMEKMPSVVRHIYLILTQLIGWTMFSSATLSGGLQTIGRYFGIGISQFADSGAWFVLMGSLALLVIAIILSSGLSKWISEKLQSMLGAYYSLLAVLGWVVIFILCVSSLMSATALTFLYAVF